MNRGFEVGASSELRALHRIPWLPPPEGDLHEHWLVAGARFAAAYEAV